MRAAVVGAGMAGAVLAVLLRQAGRDVRVFDKGRGTGGRLATRRHESGARFDHGCPGIPIPAGDPLTTVLETVIAQGSAARWAGLGEAMAVGLPGMSQIPRALLGPVTVTASFEVARADRDSAGWRLVSRTGETTDPFDALFLTVPAPQLVHLVESAAPRFAEAAAAAAYDPCWTLMLAFAPEAAATLAATAPGALDGEGVEIAIHDGGKPGREGAATLVCHMSAQWTRANLEREREDVAAELGSRIAGALGLPAPTVAMAHRWRFARVARATVLAEPWDADLSIGIAGDWTAGPDARDAFVSAVRCAGAARPGTPEARRVPA